MAGTGVAGLAGDGGPALRAQLNEPSAVAVDPAGRLFLADRSNGRIRRVDLDGAIRPVLAFADSPVIDLALTATGTLYAASASALRAVSPTGEISDFAVTAAFSAIGAIAAEGTGSLLVADGARLLRVSNAGELAEVATLPATITGVAAGPDGLIYVVAGDRVHRLERAGAISLLPGIEAVAAGARIAVDRWGDVYLSGNRIVKIVGGRPYLLAGLDEPGFSGDGGSSILARVNRPAGMSVDRAGNLFFADTLNHRVRVLRAPFAGAISAIAPTNLGTELWPRNIALRWSTLSNASSYEVLVGLSPEALTVVGTTAAGFWPLDRLTDQTTYYWRIRTRFPPLSPIESGIFSFTTTTSAAQPPSTPASPRPANFSNGQPVSLLLTWQSTGASRYDVYLGDDVYSAGPVATVIEPRLALSGLRPDQLYYWRVVAFNDTGAISSIRWQFVTGPVNGYPWLIETIAGKPVQTADGALATATALLRPGNPAADSSGNVVFIDGERTVRRINRDGKVTTVFASTASPLMALAADSSGNTYVAAAEYVIRVDRTGQRTFVAGQPGRRGFAGDGGAAAQAQTDGIGSLAADTRRNLYIADTSNNRVRVVDAVGQIRTIAGNGSCGETDGAGIATALPLCAPAQVAVDAAGAVFVYARGLVLKIASDGRSERIAGTGVLGYSGDDGPALEARIGPLSGLSVDASGRVYLLDATSMTVRQIDENGIIRLFAGERDAGGLAFGFAGDGLPAVRARFARPVGLGIDGLGNLLIGDTLNNRIRQIDAAGFTSTIGGFDTTQGDRGPGTAAYLYGPSDIAADSGGNVFIVDTLNNRIRRLTPARSLDTIAGGGAVTVRNGEIQGSSAADLSLDLSSGGAIGFDERGNLLFSTASPGVLPASGGEAVIGVALNGTIASYVETQIGQIGGIARGRMGEIYLSDTAGHRIVRLDRSGSSTTIAGTGTAGFAGEGGPASLAQVNAPRSLAISREGELYIAEFSRIRRITSDGRIVTVANETAEGLAFDGYGLLYVSAGRSIYRSVSDPRIPGQLTLARIAGRSGGVTPPDTVNPLETALNQPRGLVAVNDGELVFADSGDHVIRRMTRLAPAVMSITGGDNQATDENNTTPLPLKVKVTGRNGLPVQGVTVRYSITGGVRPVEVAAVMTNAAGEAQTRLTFRSQSGPVTVAATLGGIEGVVFQVRTR